MKIKKRTWLHVAVCALLALASGLCFLFLFLLGHSLPDQRAAFAWDADGGTRQLSVFYSSDLAFGEEQLFSVRHNVDAALSDAGLSAPNENARLWVDAYSARGNLSLGTERVSQNMDVIAVGGDFFLFHPYDLVSGSYFGGDDLVRDRVVLDETAAWQLFGAIQVEGMALTVDGKPYTVAGVVQNAQDRNVIKALNGTPLVIVPFESLPNPAITCYEVLLPEAVKGLALTTLTDVQTFPSEKWELRENSVRYTLWRLLKALPAFAERGIQVKPLIFPYWENAALTVENYALLAAVGAVAFAVYPLCALVVLLCLLWRRRPWHLSDLRAFVEDKIDQRNSRRYYRTHHL